MLYCIHVCFFVFKQKTAYELRISDWSSDVCSSDLLTDPGQYQDIRDAVRDLCSQFTDDYFREIDQRRGYPAEFVEALTKAGWLAALIPHEYGGSGQIGRASGRERVCQ